MGILYILNPHRDDFIWEPIYFRFLKRRALKKYNYISDLFIEKKEIKLVANDMCSGVVPQRILSMFPAFLRRAIIQNEIRKWIKINELPEGTKVEWLDDKLDIKPDDKLFLFQLSNLKYVKSLAGILKKFNRVFVHLSHYYLNAPTVSHTFKDLQNVSLVGDSDLSNHPFFLKYFSWYKSPFILSPFYIQDRFKNNIPHGERLHKIISTGTFHPVEEYPALKYLVEDWQADSCHVNRRSIYENQNNNAATFTCMNSPWQQNDGSWWVKWINARKVAQKKYFNLDIVAEYNKHQFALIGEEVCGFPGIGTFEAMACGCVAFINPNTVVGILDNNNCYIPFAEKISDMDLSAINISESELIEKSNAAATFINENLRKDICNKRFEKTFFS